ncbi:hypothetical protein EV586_10213 [Tumebacillus sp. BK434]|uniref:metallophosphoesterase family protein n=1 Tax=Tumebacillus sp. BK434 TaxID=2512169 RepID=UPI0010462CA4|nr:metallophosphoesterase [Tumebacillus sp. BK434]TCP57572.1 hypothetical protein EV586_10213 [Tumebacillus sp. BK434]
MKIAVISDTHMPKMATGVPPALADGLRDVDLILHAGDWQTLAAVELFEQFAPLDGVAGNVDGEEIAARFGRQKVLTIGGYKIGLVHGDGKGKTTERRAAAAFAGEKLDLIIFGHSHVPYHEVLADGTVLFNPGSPTDKRRQAQFSYGLIEIGEGMRVRHEFYAEKK